MRLFLPALLALLLMTGVVAQPIPAACGTVPADTTFKPSNCMEPGGVATLETGRFRSVSIVSLFIAGPNGRVGSGDRGVRVDGDGVLRLRIDTNDFFGARITGGAYQVIIKDVTGRVTPLIVPFTVAGTVQPPAPTTFATTPVLLASTPTPTPTSIPGSTPTTTQTPASGRTPTASGATSTATLPTSGRTPTATATPTATTINAAALCQQTPDPNLAIDDPIFISDIDKESETVVLDNFGMDTVNLDGWIMCSITGHQVHLGISGDIEFLVPGEFQHTGPNEIWDDDEQDDGALYDPTGKLISYYEDPDY